MRLLKQAKMLRRIREKEGRELESVGINKDDKLDIAESKTKGSAAESIDSAEDPYWKITTGSIPHD